ncbi:MAG: hypothetical protein JXN65_10210 [Clostridia bacterium]|nr:hypothetical protein [Clostridia bacterium]
MKKAVIAVLAALVFVFTSCEHRHFQGAEAVEPTPSPTHFTTEVPENFLASTPAPEDQVSIDVSYVNTQIDSGTLSIDLPYFLAQQSNTNTNSVFCASGVIEDSGYISYSLNVYKFYRSEDPAATLSGLY